MKEFFKRQMVMLCIDAARNSTFHFVLGAAVGAAIMLGKFGGFMA